MPVGLYIAMVGMVLFLMAWELKRNALYLTPLDTRPKADAKPADVHELIVRVVAHQPAMVTHYNVWRRQVVARRVIEVYAARDARSYVYLRVPEHKMPKHLPPGSIIRVRVDFEAASHVPKVVGVYRVREITIVHWAR